MAQNEAPAFPTVVPPLVNVEVVSYSDDTANEGTTTPTSGPVQSARAEQLEVAPTQVAPTQVAPTPSNPSRPLAQIVRESLAQRRGEGQHYLAGFLGCTFMVGLAGFIVDLSIINDIVACTTESNPNDDPYHPHNECHNTIYMETMLNYSYVRGVNNGIAMVLAAVALCFWCGIGCHLHTLGCVGISLVAWGFISFGGTIVNILASAENTMSVDDDDSGHYKAMAPFTAFCSILKIVLSLSLGATLLREEASFPSAPTLPIFALVILTTAVHNLYYSGDLHGAPQSVVNICAADIVCSSFALIFSCGSLLACKAEERHRRTGLAAVWLGLGLVGGMSTSTTFWVEYDQNQKNNPDDAYKIGDSDYAGAMIFLALCQMAFFFSTALCAYIELDRSGFLATCRSMMHTFQAGGPSAESQPLLGSVNSSSPLFCMHCGARLPAAQARFCSQCGSAVQ